MDICIMLVQRIRVLPVVPDVRLLHFVTLQKDLNRKQVIEGVQIFRLSWHHLFQLLSSAYVAMQSYR